MTEPRKWWMYTSSHKSVVGFGDNPVITIEAVEGFDMREANALGIEVKARLEKGEEDPKDSRWYGYGRPGV